LRLVYGLSVYENELDTNPLLDKRRYTIRIYYASIGEEDLIYLCYLPVNKSTPLVELI